MPLDPKATPQSSPGPSNPPPSIDPIILESVETSGLMSISTQPAMLSNVAWSNDVANNNLGAQNAVANQQAMNELRSSVVSHAVSRVSDLAPLEARSAVDVLTNDEMAQTIADLKGTLAAFASGRSPTPKSGPVPSTPLGPVSPTTPGAVPLTTLGPSTPGKPPYMATAPIALMFNKPVEVKTDETGNLIINATPET